MMIASVLPEEILTRFYSNQTDRAWVEGLQVWFEENKSDKVKAKEMFRCFIFFRALNRLNCNVSVGHGH